MPWAPSPRIHRARILLLPQAPKYHLAALATSDALEPAHHVGMGDIDILLYNYCEARLSRLLPYTENYLQMCSNCKTCHDKCQLSQYYMIIVSSKNTISIVGKENIMVNRQNQLIAHPYHHAAYMLTIFQLVISEQCSPKIWGFCSTKIYGKVPSPRNEQTGHTRLARSYGEL